MAPASHRNQLVLKRGFFPSTCSLDYITSEALVLSDFPRPTTSFSPDSHQLPTYLLSRYPLWERLALIHQKIWRRREWYATSFPSPSCRSSCDSESTNIRSLETNLSAYQRHG